MASSYTLGERYEKLIRALVDSGRYASASEVVRDSLRLLEEREQEREARLAKLRGLIREGLGSGAPESWDPQELRQDIRNRRRNAG